MLGRGKKTKAKRESATSSPDMDMKNRTGSRESETSWFEADQTELGEEF